MKKGVDQKVGQKSSQENRAVQIKPPLGLEHFSQKVVTFFDMFWKKVQGKDRVLDIKKWYHFFIKKG